MRGMRVAWLVALAGCGRLGFAPVSTSLDGGSDDSADATDGAPDAFMPPSGPFGTPTMITGLGAVGSNDDPSMTADLLELFLESDRSGGVGAGDLYVATRLVITDPFSPPVNLAVLNTAGDDVTPSISGDGLTLLFSSRRTGALGAAEQGPLREYATDANQRVVGAGVDRRIAHR